MKVIKLEARRLDPKTEKIHGVEFRVALSPYFFPEHLECDYDEDTDSVVIHFRYPDNELGKDHPDREGLVTLSIGEHTHRLLGVRIHVGRHDINRIRMLVTDNASKAIREFRDARPALKDLEENYEIAENALRDHGEQIAQLVPA